jgi:hypothetical protein
VSEDFARSTARFQLSSAASSLAVANTALKSAQATSAQWSDGFWAVSGYNKAAVTGALERLVAAVDEFQATHAADIAILNNQAEA